MSPDWNELDTTLRWDKRKTPTLTPKQVMELRRGDEVWHVLGERGEKGNQDIIALIDAPTVGIERVESLKQLVDDIDDKCVADSAWMRARFMPALVRVAGLEESTEAAISSWGPTSLPGLPPEVLLTALQVIALSEFRRYGSHEPFGGRFLLIRVCVGLAWGLWARSDVDYGTLLQNAVAVLRARKGLREPSLGFVLASDPDYLPRSLSQQQLIALSI